MKKKIVFLPYDFDTAIGINNEGALVFSYNLEDIDQTEGGADVFNGQQSVLWKNVRAAFFDDLKAMYQQLRSTGALSYEKAERMFEEHQAKWPEAIFNEDAWFKYLAPLVEKGNGSYLAMLQGSKAEQRKWWLYNRFRYMDSKYNAGDSLSDVITVRGYAKANITVTPYADVYASIKYGSYLVQTRAARNYPSTLPCPLDNVNDTEIYIYSASQLADVGDLSGLMVGYADFSKALKLQRLKLGDASETYSNGNMTELYLGNNELLRTVDVRNCPNLTQAVDLSGCSNLEHVYFDGTAITGLELPNGGILKTLHLPATMTNLTILNQSAITEFSIPSYENLSTIRLENVSDAVNSREIISHLAPGSRLRLTGIRWEMDSFNAVLQLYDQLDTLRGLDENGGNLEKAQVSGVIILPDVTSDRIRELRARYADINITAPSITYNVRFFDGTNPAPLYTTQVIGGESVQDPVAAHLINVPYKDSEGHTAFRYVGWDKSLENISGDTDFIAQYVEDVGYVVTFKNWDDTILFRRIVAYGSTVPDPVETGEIEPPTRPNDASYAYTFLSWTGASLTNITNDRTLTARYATRPAYTVTFKDWDNKTLCVYYIATGEDCPNPIEDGTIHAPERPEDTANQRTYTFTGWSGSLKNVTGNRTITAQYSTFNYVYAIFKNWDGTELYRERIAKNGTATDPVAGGRMAVPEKPAAEYNYFFRKWDRNLPCTLSSNTVFTALFKTDQTFIVTFIDYDNTVLDTQYVSQYNDAVDPVAANRILTPVRLSTAQYDYVYNGWQQSLKEITADRTIAVRYTSVLRYYPVRYFDSDGETLMVSQDFGYGSNAAYPGDIIKPGVDKPEDYYLYLWEPTSIQITGPVDYTAVWHRAILDTWEQILAAGENGTYAQKYNVGDVVMLDLGTEGIVPFELVAKDADELADGSGNAHMTWLALAPLATQRVMGTRSTGAMTVTGHFNLVEQEAGEGEEESVGVMYRTDKITHSHACASQFTITANEALSMRIVCTCSAEANFDMMSVRVNDEWIVTGFAKPEGVTKEATYELAAGDTMEVLAQWVKDGSVDSGRDCAEITFISEGDFTIEKTEPTKTVAAGGSAGGWPKMPLRAELAPAVLPCFPENVREAIKPVKKISAISNTEQVETEETIWIPSRREYCKPNPMEKSGVMYDGTFDGTRYPIARRGAWPGITCWTRSRNGDNFYVITNPASEGNSSCSSACGIIIGFCI